MKTVRYEDELYLLTLILRELEHGARLELDSVRFLDRLQADIAFLDEAVAEHAEALRSNPHLPGRLDYLRSLHRVELDFCSLLAELVRGSNVLGRALAPLRETLLAMEQTHARLAQAAGAILLEASEGRPPEQHVISDEEFRILLADEPE